MAVVLSTGSIVAGYRIVRLAGRGATGTVYLAEDAGGRQVALKLLIPELAQDGRFRERFLREAEIAAGLDEPHVVPTIATGEYDGSLYLVMPYVDGLDLREILKREGPLGGERAVDLAGQIASALDAAHALGLVHRDVKPGNVLVRATEEGEHAYLCDFGLAKHVSSVNSLTGERAFVGTIAYISPEQIEGGTIDGAADVYSLGCLLFECLTGQAPFARESELATVYAHMNEPPPRASDVRPGLPEGFDGVLAKALAKSPGERYATCGELAAAARAALRGELPIPPVRRRRRLAAGALAALALVAAAGVALAVRGNGGGTPATPRLAIAPRTLGLIDARTREVVARIPFTSQPWDVVFDSQRAWVLLGDERRVARVDLASHRVLSSAKLPFLPGGIAVGDGAAWVTEDNGPGLVRLSGASGQIAKRFAVAIRSDRNATPTGIAFGAGSVWVARGPETVRVDPASGLALKRIPTPLAGTSVVFAGGAVWVASAEDGRVVKIDPATDRVTAATLLHATITDLTVGNGSVWVAIVPDDVVYRLSPADGSVLATIPGGAWPAALSTGGGLWIADAKGRRLVHVDPAGRRTSVALSGPLWAARYHAGLLWTSVGAPEPTAAAPKGQTLRIPLLQSLGNLDPGVSGGPVFAQVAYSTCAYLLNYADAPGAAGRVLRPEVAAGMPQVSRDGLTTTFRVRPGFRFSPPSGQPVTAETFRSTIERALSPKLVAGGNPNQVGALLSDVVGATAFAAGRAPHIRGITVRGATLTFRLTRPAGDLAARLQSPFFCPVPSGTPMVPEGAPAPVAMAGPYYVASAGGGRLILERNPNYSGDRPRRIARIVFSDGATSAAAISQVQEGRADYVSGNTVGLDPAGPLAPGGALDRAYGLSSRKGRAGAARYVPSPIAGSDGIEFNTQRPLFHDVRMRRAVAEALDRTALAAVFGEPPSDRLIPPAVSGSGGNIAYANEPDLTAARRLAGTGRRRTARLYFCGDPLNQRIAEIIRSNLAPIGIAVQLDRSSGCLTGPEPDRLAAADLQLFSDPTLVSDPASFFEFLFAIPPNAPGHLTNVQIRQGIASARGTRGAARTAAYARLETEIVRDDVPATIYASWVNPEFFSARVGCKVEQGALDFVDLGALCLR